MAFEPPTYGGQQDALPLDQQSKLNVDNKPKFPSLQPFCSGLMTLSPMPLNEQIQTKK